jgi:peroxiredoxin
MTLKYSIMVSHKIGNKQQKKLTENFLTILIKMCLTTVLVSMSFLPCMGQVSSDTTRSKKQTTYLLPDGRALSLAKWDSLEQAWGKGRIILQHTEEDDKKGTIHLVRLTDEMLQQMADRDRESKKALAALLDKPAPDFELKDLRGKQWSLKALRGKIVVLNFWFTSCIPCIGEMPELNKLTKIYHANNVVFLGLTFNNTEQINLFLKKRSFDYVLLPGSHEVDEKYKISSWPTSIIIDKQGNIKKILHSDPNIREELGTTIDSLL